jgi:hypothetical protein
MENYQRIEASNCQVDIRGNIIYIESCGMKLSRSLYSWEGTKGIICEDTKYNIELE